MSALKTIGLHLQEDSRPVRTNRFWSLYGVWFRHYRVYTNTLLANALPPVLEPLFFFTAIAFGLGKYLPEFEEMPYRAYIASGILVTSAMFTGIYECTFGTFVRLVFQKAYDAMLGTHLRVSEIFTGEMIFTGTKGAVFSTIVMLVTAAFGVRLSPWCALVPLVGFLTGYLYGAIGLIVCSYVKTINNFNFFLTGVVTPMFFLSGAFFPIRGIHPAVDVVSYINPLSHSVQLSRALYKAELTAMTGLSLSVLLGCLIVCHAFAIHRMRNRVLS